MWSFQDDLIGTRQRFRCSELAGLDHGFLSSDIELRMANALVIAAPQGG
jgi:hypothetical protein